MANLSTHPTLRERLVHNRHARMRIMRRVVRYSSRLLCALMLPAALATCRGDEPAGPDRASLSRVPTLTASDTSVQLHQLDFDNTALALDWTPGSNHGTNAAIEYALEFDTTGG